VVLPNGKVFGDTIVNFSFHDTRRVDAVFKAPVAADIRPLLAALEARARENPRVLAEPPVQTEIVGMWPRSGPGCAGATIQASRPT
jgi:small conductance mechanosensitive channel